MTEKAKKLGDESAYPIVGDMPEIYSISRGLTKREYFAALSMQGLRAAGCCESYAEDGSRILWKDQIVAKQAVADADALLEELAK